MKKNNRKLTRNSFKRKIIVFGVAVFMSVAMVATGFAAWVISSNARTDGSVGVEVAEISESNLEVEFDTTLFTAVKGGVHNEKLTFGPQHTDTAGYIKASAGTTADSIDVENLMVKVKGIVKNDANLGSLVMTIDLSELGAAIDANYLALDVDGAELVEGETYKYTVDLKDGHYTAGGEENPGTFEIDFKLKWGSRFGNANPGIYFDNGTHTEFDGKVDDQIATYIKEEMTKFNTAVGGKNVKLTVVAEVA